MNVACSSHWPAHVVASVWRDIRSQVPEEYAPLLHGSFPASFGDCPIFRAWCCRALTTALQGSNVVSAPLDGRDACSAVRPSALPHLLFRLLGLVSVLVLLAARGPTRGAAPASLKGGFWL